MSMPTSAMAATAAGLTSVGRLGAAGPADGAVAGEVVEPAGGHLGAAGVVDAEEQDGRGVGRRGSSERSESVARRVEVGVQRKRIEAEGDGGADELHER